MCLVIVICLDVKNKLENTFILAENDAIRTLVYLEWSLVNIFVKKERKREREENTKENHTRRWTIRFFIFSTKVWLNERFFSFLSRRKKTSDLKEGETHITTMLADERGLLEVFEKSPRYRWSMCWWATLERPFESLVQLHRQDLANVEDYSYKRIEMRRRRTKESEWRTSLHWASAWFPEGFERSRNNTANRYFW